MIKNNLTNTEDAIDVEKEFLNSAEAFAIVSADERGNPSGNIKGIKKSK